MVAAVSWGGAMAHQCAYEDDGVGPTLDLAGTPWQVVSPVRRQPVREQRVR